MNEDLRQGRHAMHVQVDTRTAEKTALPTPDAQILRLDKERRAGVCMHLTSLPGPHGIGEIGRDAQTFVDRLAAAGLRIWQFLPTGPTAYGDSPYQPLSTYAGNPMLIELRELCELGLLTEAELQPLCTLPVDSVDYGSLIPTKSALLAKAAERFRAQSTTALHDAFDDYLERTGPVWLDDYALFRTLKRAHGDRPWPEWNLAYRRREQDALDKFIATHDTELYAIKFCEFMFDKQWQALRDHARQAGVLLFGDMPIYIALDSADAWANREILRLDDDGQPAAVAGVPPDYFSEDGQLWGNPLYDWAYHDRSGFGWWVERMRHTLSLVDVVRIDHFRGFEAYWSVPLGADTARDGAWEQGPNDAIFDALHNELGDMPIVAEDLGAITPAVDELRMRHRMPGMSVLQFMIDDPDFDLESIGVDSVCYTGTHDNDTTVGWYRGGPGDVRTPEQIAMTQHNALRHIGGIADNIHWAMINAAFSTAACLAIVPMQDFLGLGSEARINTPGSSANNWRWRLQAESFDAALQERIAQLATDHAR
ncbi:MAG: 4-alpha-glucanotransferase [Pseudomonadota bacterium]